MLTGFNTNIRHRGVLFHVQSEDSGRDHPHVITHLFHGGNIMASEKSSYADQLEAPDLEPIVRGIMENQHKAVLKRLRAGEFDAVILERVGPSVFDDEPLEMDLAEESRAEAEILQSGTDASSLVSDPTGMVEPETIHTEPIAPRGSAEEPEPDAGRPFGEGIVSDKPLDEVILNYLVENARKRKRQQAG